jgi:4'-phosphopantetheinyl transferase EntD
VTLGTEPPFPYAGELEAIAGASRLRRREFLSGRACAHAALRAIDRDGAPIGRGSMGEPLWPAGVVGSISHGGRLAGAVAARTADVWSVGLDIELLEPPLEAAVERMVLRPGELARGRHLARIAFAIKECVYKCLYPGTGWRLGFHDVAVEIDPVSSHYTAEIDGPWRMGASTLGALEGRFAIWRGHVLVGLVMASADQGRGTDRSPRGRRPPRACSSASA